MCCEDKLVWVLRKTFLVCVNIWSKHSHLSSFCYQSFCFFFFVSLCNIITGIMIWTWSNYLIKLKVLSSHSCCYSSFCRKANYVVKTKAETKARQKLHSKHSPRVVEAGKHGKLKLNLETRFYLNFSNNILLKFSLTITSINFYCFFFYVSDLPSMV